VREEKRKNKGELHVMVSREMWDVGEWKKEKVKTVFFIDGLDRQKFLIYFCF
jgi:hypothetical protein